MTRQVPSYLIALKKGIVQCIGIGLLWFFSSCHSESATENNDSISKYVIPTFKKANNLEISNPDSSLLLCDYMLRLLNEDEKNDSLRLEIELLKVRAITNKGFDDKALTIYAQLLAEQTKKNNVFTVALINFNIANLLNDIGRCDEAESYVDNALKGFDTRTNKVNRGNALNLKGTISKNLGRFKEAEISLNEALSIFEAEQMNMESAYVLQNIGNVHFDLKDSILARDYYLRSVAILENSNNINALGSIYNNIGIIYRYMNPDSALYYYNKVPSPDGENTNLQHYVISLFNKANIYKDQFNYKKARENYDEVYAICTSNKILQGIPRVLYSYGEIEFDTGDFLKAINYINQSLYWCDSLGAIPLKQDVLKGKIYMYSKKGLYKEAFELQQQFDRTEDSIKSNETKESVAKIEKMNREQLMLMDKLEKERQLKSKANSDKKRLLVLLPAIMAIMIGGAIYYRYRKRAASSTR